MNNREGMVQSWGCNRRSAIGGRCIRLVDRPALACQRTAGFSCQLWSAAGTKRSTPVLQNDTPGQNRRWAQRRRLERTACATIRWGAHNHTGARRLSGDAKLCRNPDSLDQARPLADVWDSFSRAFRES